MNSKQREELQRISDGITMSPLFNGLQTITNRIQLKEIKRIVDTILAEPVRNCEVGTAEEQYQRYEKFCCSHYSITDNGDGNCLKCPFSEPICKFAWAQMPYEAKESEVKK